MPGSARRSPHIGDVQMARTPKTPEVPASPPVTFDLNDPALQAIIAQAVAVAMAAKEAEKPAKPATDQSTKNELATIKAFKKKFNIIVKPKVDVLTFNKWIEQGLRPKEGEHAVKVANLRLFCKSQCRPLTKAEAGEFAKKFREAEAKRSAKVVPINQPSA
jgi:hypothetical protein